MQYLLRDDEGAGTFGQRVTVGIQRGPSYLLAVATGPADAAEKCSRVVFVADMLRRTRTKRLLFDITGLRPHYDKADALEVLSALYASLPPMERSRS